MIISYCGFVERLKLYLLFLNRLKDLDNATLIAIHIYPFENLAVFSPPYFANNLVIILITETSTDTKANDTKMYKIKKNNVEQWKQNGNQINK